MGFRLQIIFAFLSGVEMLQLLVVALQATHGALPAPQLYWNSVLPNTQMPKAISRLLRPSTDSVVASPDRIPKRNCCYGYERPELNNDTTADFFFLEKDIMRSGTTMKMDLRTKTAGTANFLPRDTADSIPFSSNKLPEILALFKVKPGSAEGKMVEQAIEDCELPNEKGEEKHCATSLESMIDFSTTKLGTRNVEAITTEVLEKGNINVPVQRYIKMRGVKKLVGKEEKAVVCHKIMYPYAVFYCHLFQSVVPYLVPLKAADHDGAAKGKALAICHVDTSEWSPKFLAFQLLKVEPGTPLCHFLPNYDNLVWVPKRTIEVTTY